ncbi:transposase [Rhizobium azibense]|uniref:transposase n=1 Tax=Rhizobium azibense TaxID=1136135 RepID=UPI001FE16AE2|nr:transposase [Rhizobium azibense]
MWIEIQLAPTLSTGDVVILDNVGFHKSERAEELVKACSARLLFLPPYSQTQDTPAKARRAMLRRHCAGPRRYLQPLLRQRMP